MAVVKVKNVVGTTVEGRSLEEVLGWIDRGELRVPAFGRGFVWGTEERLALFESVERNHPIGSVVVLDAAEEIPSVAEFAGRSLPDVSEEGAVSYLLDGHQRLATLYGGLQPQARVRTGNDEDPRWRVHRRLGDSEDGENPYLQWEDGDAIPPHLLPMRSVLRTMDFLAFVRGLEDRGELPVPEFVAEAEEVARRFKSYRLPVVRMRGGGAAQASLVFQSINHGGRHLSAEEVRVARESRGS
ncbi:DUF262 domain-containing protein [Nocardiopsis sp. NPDC055824]